GLAQRLHDRLGGTAVVGLDEHRAGLGDGERAELLQRGRGTVVVHEDLVEHPRVGTAGADVADLLTGDLDRLVHLVLGLEEDLVDHRCSFVSSPAAVVVPSVVPSLSAAGASPPPTVTSVQIFSLIRAPVPFPGLIMPLTCFDVPLTM